MTYNEALLHINKLPKKNPDGQDLVHFVVPSDPLTRAIAKDYILTRFPNIDREYVRNLTTDDSYEIATMIGNASFFGDYHF